jgi:hypothetical protein
MFRQGSRHCTTTPATPARSFACFFVPGVAARLPGLAPAAWAVSRVTVCVTAWVALCVAGCKDQAKESAAHAAQDAAGLASLVDRDVSEIERGLPQGAARLAPLVANGADPKQDIAAARKGLFRVRREVMDLNMAKSTFFALADASGVAIRNDLEEDVMAGQNLMAIFPALAKALDGYVTMTGVFPNVTAKNGPDEDWVAAAPVKRENGSAGAILLTGWTYRYFARHLQESLKDRLAERAKAGENGGKLPIFYVAVFDRSGVYSAPLTPEVDEKALAAQDLPAKTAGGAYQGTVDITDRPFGFAALRVPRLAADTGVVVLRSEL